MLSTQTATVLDALVAALKVALPGVEVVDGQPTSAELNDPDVLLVGFSPSRTAVEVEQTRSDLGGTRRAETLSIACLASSWRGETDMSAVRAKAVEIVDAVRAALAANRSLDGAVRRAELGFGMSLDQAQTADGATSALDFTIQVVTL